MRCHTPPVRLAPFEPHDHLPLLAAWLRQADITRWWGDSAETLAAVLAHPVATEALIEVDAVPVGFICWQRLSPDELAAAGLSDLPADLIDVDIMIGEASHVGHGVGPAALAQLLARLRADGVTMVGLATTLANTRALRAFEKAGFHSYRDFREAGQAWRYLVQRLGATG